MSTVAAGSYLATYMMSAEVVTSTSPATKFSTSTEEKIDRSFIGRVPWVYVNNEDQVIAAQTSALQAYEIIVGPDRIEDHLVSEIREFGNLGEGWDGDNAARPNLAAIKDATDFIHAAWSAASIFEPTIHVDGSIILEVADDVGSLRFKGDGKIIYFLEKIGRGTVPFNGVSTPIEIAHLLEDCQ